MIHNGPKKYVENYYFFVQEFSRLLKSREGHWSTGNLGLLFLFFPETSIFIILHLCFELSRITGIFGIPEIPEKSSKSQKNVSDQNVLANFVAVQSMESMCK
jgi:hypothetical protein